MDRRANPAPQKKTQSEMRFVPKKVAQRCPVCNGFGTLKWGSKTCQACEGRGYVLVPAVIETRRPMAREEAYK